MDVAASRSRAFVSCQERYQLLERDLDRELMRVIESYGLGLIPFSPLADGLLTGKYRRDAPMPAGTRFATTPHIAARYLTEANWAVVERLEAFCAARGHTLLELAFSWLCTGRLSRASSPGPPRPSRSKATSAPPGGRCRAKTWTK